MPNAAAWLTAANPFHRARTADEALRQARIGSVALLIMAVSGILSTLWTYLRRDDLEAFMAQAMAADPQLAGSEMAQGMISGMTTFTLALGVIFVAVYLILAIVQWQRPSHWIPIILLVIALWGILTMVQALVIPRPNMPSMQDALAMTPVWMRGLGYAEQIVTTVLLIASWRGAWALKTRFKPPETDVAG